MVIILTKWEAVTQGTCALRRQLSLIKTPLITQDYHAELPKRGIVSATAKNASLKGAELSGLASAMCSMKSLMAAI